MDWLSDNLWAGWLSLAVLFGVLELISLDLFLAMLAGGAVVGAVTDLLGGSEGLQIILALVTSVALLGFIRPSVVHRLHSGPTLKVGAEALIGKRATVLRELTHGTPGRVKIGGDEWTAVPYDEDDRIEAGEVVDVVQIKGATAYVLRAHRLGS
jgi:membrane protein implicated in regulation of membrane protease activity